MVKINKIRKLTNVIELKDDKLEKNKMKEKWNEGYVKKKLGIDKTQNKKQSHDLNL